MGSTESREVVVIGAGLSGLAFAHAIAAAGRDVIVLEERESPGGCIRTERLPGGFWLELGAHTLYNSYGTLLAAIDALDLRARILPRAKAPYRLLVEGRLRSVPSQIRLGELLASAWRAFSEEKEGRTVADYYRRLVGRRNFENVLSPLFAAVPSQSADGFPADLLFKRRPRRKDVPRSFTFEGGLGTLVEGLARVRGVSVRTGAPARSAARTGRRFAVEIAGGGIVETERLALAVPPAAAARLLEPVAPGAAGLLGRIPSAGIESVGVVFAADATALPRVAGIVPTADLFFSAVTRDVVPDERLRGATFHFRPGPPIDERLRRMSDVLGVSPDRFQHVASHTSSLPSPGLGHADLVRQIDGQLAGTGLFLIGNYFGGLAIEDCAIRAGLEAARLLVQG